jgi:rsbT co-antagonist protein RsbR
MADWSALLRQSLASRRDPVNEAELLRQSREFLATFTAAAETDRLENVNGEGWRPVRDVLSRISQSLARQGFTAGETATVVMSLKHPSLTLNKTVDKSALAAETGRPVPRSTRSRLTTEAYQKSRGRDSAATAGMLEPSTPPSRCGQVFSRFRSSEHSTARAQVVMEPAPANRGHGIDDRDSRHHRRPDRRHAHTTPAEDFAAARHGRGLHHQRHQAADANSSCTWASISTR